MAQINLYTTDAKPPTLNPRAPTEAFTSGVRRLEAGAAEGYSEAQQQVQEGASIFRKQLATEQARAAARIEEEAALQKRKEAIENQSKAKAFSAQLAVEATELQMKVMSDPNVSPANLDTAFRQELDKLLAKRMGDIRKTGLSSEAQGMLRVDLITLKGNAVVQMKKESLKRTVERAEEDFLKFEDLTKQRWLNATDQAAKDGLLNEYLAHGMQLVAMDAFTAPAFQKRAQAFGRELKIENITNMIRTDPLAATKVIEDSDLMPTEKLALEKQSIAQMEMLVSQREANERAEHKALRKVQELNEVNLANKILSAKSSKDLNAVMASIPEMVRAGEIGDDRAIQYQQWAANAIENIADRADRAADRAARAAGRSDPVARDKLLNDVLKSGGNIDVLKVASAAGVSYEDRVRLVNETQSLQRENNFWKDNGVQAERADLKSALTVKPGLLDSVYADLQPELKAKLNRLPEQAENELYMALSRQAGPGAVMTNKLREAVPLEKRRILEQFEPVLKSVQESIKPRYRTEEEASRAIRNGDLTEDEARIEALRWQEKRRIDRLREGK